MGLSIIDFFHYFILLLVRLDNDGRLGKVLGGDSVPDIDLLIKHADRGTGVILRMTMVVDVVVGDGHGQRLEDLTE